MDVPVMGRRLVWADVARGLGIPETGPPTVPAWVTCPLCKFNRMGVYHDDTTGYWLACPNCGVADDVIGWAERRWSLSTPAAVTRLVELQVLPGEILENLNTLIDRRQRLADPGILWETARRRLPAGIEHVAGLLRRLRVPFAHLLDRWDVTMAPLVGLAERNEIRRAVRDNPRHDDRIFRGRGWSSVLVLPYTTAPGRVVGLTVVGRSGGPGDVVFARPAFYTRGAAEGGLYPHGALGGSEPLVALNDPLTVLRMQARHFALTDRPLPLAAFIDQPKTRTGPTGWQTVRNRRVIVVASGVGDPVAVVQAWHVGGDLIVGTPDVRRPDLFVRQMQAAARPWPVVVSQWLRDDPDLADALSGGLEARGLSTVVFSRFLEADAAERLVGRMLDGYAGPRWVEYGAGRVRETADGWLYETGRSNGSNHSRRQRLTDFVLRVQRVTIAADGRARYDCRVIRHGREFRIVCADNQSLSRQLLLAGVGPVYVASGWERRLWTIAAAFVQPEIVREDRPTDADGTDASRPEPPAAVPAG